ncbi:MAG: hypothetical protein KC466_15770, partial [Myxococcales bacterium]|nr:hypothetical protein [Myxococcales bacterium]
MSPRETVRSFRPIELFAIATVVTLAVAAGAKALDLPRRLNAGEIARADDLNANFQALADEIEVLRAQVTALEQAQAKAGANPALALGPYVRVETGTLDGLAGPHVIFEGANVHVRGGGGATDDANGLGNLILGYDAVVDPDAGRTGSHNLVVGDGHGFTSHGGIVAGRENRIEGAGAVALGGWRNDATGAESAVLGGTHLAASGERSAVLGGWGGRASGDYAAVSGGQDNEAGAPYASVAGGRGNTAAGAFASVGGGQSNRAEGDYSVV